MKNAKPLIWTRSSHFTQLAIPCFTGLFTSMAIVSQCDSQQANGPGAGKHYLDIHSDSECYGESDFSTAIIVDSCFVAHSETESAPSSALLSGLGIAGFFITSLFLFNRNECHRYLAAAKDERRDIVKGQGVLFETRSRKEVELVPYVFDQVTSSLEEVTIEIKNTIECVKAGKQYGSYYRVSINDTSFEMKEWVQQMLLSIAKQVDEAIRVLEAATRQELPRQIIGNHQDGFINLVQALNAALAQLHEASVLIDADAAEAELESRAQGSPLHTQAPRHQGAMTNATIRNCIARIKEPSCASPKIETNFLTLNTTVDASVGFEAVPDAQRKPAHGNAYTTPQKPSTASESVANTASNIPITVSMANILERIRGSSLRINREIEAFAAVLRLQLIGNEKLAVTANEDDGITRAWEPKNDESSAGTVSAHGQAPLLVETANHTNAVEADETARAVFPTVVAHYRLHTPRLSIRNGDLNPRQQKVEYE